MSWTVLLSAVLLPVALVSALPNPQDSESLPTLTFSTAVASPSDPASTLPSQVPFPPTQPWCPSEIFCPGAVSAAYIPSHRPSTQPIYRATAPPNRQYRSTVL